MADETEVEIKQDTPPPVTEVVIDKAKAEKTPETKIVTADEGVAELKAQVERAKADSQRRLQEADRQIAEARRQALEAMQETATVKTGAVATVLDSLAKDKDAARRDYRAAMEAGDFEKAADATDRISEANAKIQEAKRGQLELEAQAKQPNQGRQLAEPVVSDNVERIARAMQSTTAANWVRAHPEQVTETGLSPKVMSAHYDAVANGLTEDSPQYYAHIDSMLGGRTAVRQQETERETSRAPTAAPVGRDVVQSPGAQRPGTVRLNANQVKAALETLSPLYPNASKDELLQIYAKNRQDLVSEGRIAS